MKSHYNVKAYERFQWLGYVSFLTDSHTGFLYIKNAIISFALPYWTSCVSFTLCIYFTCNNKTAVFAQATNTHISSNQFIHYPWQVQKYVQAEGAAHETQLFTLKETRSTSVNATRLYLLLKWEKIIFRWPLLIFELLQSCLPKVDLNSKSDKLLCYGKHLEMSVVPRHCSKNVYLLSQFEIKKSVLPVPRCYIKTSKYNIGSFYLLMLAGYGAAPSWLGS